MKYQRNPDDPFDRWQRLGLLTRLVVLSTRVRAIPAPLSLIFLGPPGDGKTEMLFRAETLQHVAPISDATYNGIMHFAALVRDREKSAMLLPDLGTLVGRKSDVATQTIGNLAALAAEGLRETYVGRIIRDFRGAQASILTAITPKEFERHQVILGTGAFLSRCFLVDFDLDLPELLAMMEHGMRKNGRSNTLLRPFWALIKGKKVALPLRTVELPKMYQAVCTQWWKDLHQQRPDMFYGFRSGHAMRTLAKAAAYLNGRARVTRADLKTVEMVLPLIFAQVKLRRETAT